MDKAERLNCDLLIVGGGAAGFAAALKYKSLCPKRHVIICERLPGPLKKLRATGNGRCNLAPGRFSAAALHSSSVKQAEAIMSALPQEEVLKQFRSWGLPLSLVNGAYYPASLRAESVIEVLLKQAERRKIQILTETVLTAMPGPADSQGKLLVRFRQPERNLLISASYLLLTPGGKAQPALGSDGSVLQLMKQAGYKMEKSFPALDSLLLEAYPKRLRGTRLRASAAIMSGENGRLLSQDAGEIIFNKNGVSGIPIMQQSALAAYLLAGGSADAAGKYVFRGDLSETARETLGSGHSGESLFSQEEAEEALLRSAEIFRLRGKKKLWLLLDFVPYTEEERFASFWQAQIEALGQDAETLARALLPADLAVFICENLKKLGRSGDVLLLGRLLKCFAFPVKAGAGFERAQVTAGGLSFTELEDHSLRLKKSPRVFAAGEVLDVYGDCGGFNLLWAWSSGLTAAKEISAEEGKEHVEKG